MASSCTTLYMRKRRIALVNGVVGVEETTKEVHNMELLERQCGPQTEDKASHYNNNCPCRSYDNRLGGNVATQYSLNRLDHDLTKRIISRRRGCTGRPYGSPHFRT